MHTPASPNNWLNSLHMAALTAAHVREQGISTTSLLTGTGITANELLDLHGLINPHQEQQVFLNALRLTGSNTLGLELGQKTRISAYGMLGYAMLSAPTLGEALNIALSYPVLLGTYFNLQLRHDAEGVWLQACSYKQSAELRPFNTQLCLASLSVICNDLLQQPLPIIALQLDHHEPLEAVHMYARLLGQTPTLECAHSGFKFASDWLKQPLPLADPVTHKEMLKLCSLQNAEFAANRVWLARVRELLGEQLQSPPPMEQLAQTLNCSVRSLRRKLDRHQTSYRKLLDDLRFERAKYLLKHSELPIYQIAEQLGFSEPAGLRHAFQRWSGQSPSRYRS